MASSVECLNSLITPLFLIWLVSVSGHPMENCISGTCHRPRQHSYPYVHTLDGYQAGVNPCHHPAPEYASYCHTPAMPFGASESGRDGYFVNGHYYPPTGGGHSTVWGSPFEPGGGYKLCDPGSSSPSYLEYEDQADGSVFQLVKDWFLRPEDVYDEDSFRLRGGGRMTTAEGTSHGDDWVTNLTESLFGQMQPHSWQTYYQSGDQWDTHQPTHPNLSTHSRGGDEEVRSNHPPRSQEATGGGGAYVDPSRGGSSQHRHETLAHRSELNESVSEYDDTTSSYAQSSRSARTVTSVFEPSHGRGVPKNVRSNWNTHRNREFWKESGMPLHVMEKIGKEIYQEPFQVPPLSPSEESLGYWEEAQKQEESMGPGVSKKVSGWWSEHAYDRGDSVKKRVAYVLFFRIRTQHPEKVWWSESQILGIIRKFPEDWRRMVYIGDILEFQDRTSPFSNSEGRRLEAAKQLCRLVGLGAREPRNKVQGGRWGMSFACRHLKEAFVDENGESLYKTRMIQVLGYSTLYPSIRKLFVGYVPGENSISRDVKARIYPFLFLDWVTSGLDPNSMRDFGKILALGRLGHRDVKKLDKMLVSSLMERVFGSLCEEEKFEMKMARTWYERLFKEKVVASYLKGLRSISTE